jgi:hypothetical protein
MASLIMEFFNGKSNWCAGAGQVRLKQQLRGNDHHAARMFHDHAARAKAGRPARHACSGSALPGVFLSEQIHYRDAQPFCGTGLITAAGAKPH